MHLKVLTFYSIPPITLGENLNTSQWNNFIVTTFHSTFTDSSHELLESSSSPVDRLVMDSHLLRSVAISPSSKSKDMIVVVFTVSSKLTNILSK